MKGNLDLHIQKLKNRSIAITKEIMAMGSQREVGEEYLRMRMHLFEKCYMHAILHGLHAWHITGEEVQAVKRVQSNYLKEILELPTSTPSAALFMETRDMSSHRAHTVPHKHAMMKSGSIAATIVQAQQKSKQDKGYYAR